MLCGFPACAHFVHSLSTDCILLQSVFCVIQLHICYRVSVLVVVIVVVAVEIIVVVAAVEIVAVLVVIVAVVVV